MKLISTLAAAATMFAATSIVPAGAVTPAPLNSAQTSPVENVAMVCREVCRGGFCRESCRWRPDRGAIRVTAIGAMATITVIGAMAIVAAPASSSESGNGSQSTRLQLGPARKWPGFLVGLSASIRRDACLLPAPCMREGLRQNVSAAMEVAMTARFAIGLVTILLANAPAHAQSVADFYRGKTVQLLIAYTAGGNYDLNARLLARHIGKHIPGNPNVVPQNFVGAAGLRLANFLYNVAPKDGTTIAMLGRGTPMEPLFGNTAAQYDARRYIWLGSISDEVSLCVSWHTSKVKNFDDLLYDAVCGRRTRPRIRQRHVRAHAAQRLRRQDPTRPRLSGRQRDQSRDGARRGRRPLRLVVGQHQDHPGHLAREKADQPGAADRAAAGS